MFKANLLEKQIKQAVNNKKKKIGKIKKEFKIANHLFAYQLRNYYVNV